MDSNLFVGLFLFLRFFPACFGSDGGEYRGGCCTPLSREASQYSRAPATLDPCGLWRSQTAQPHAAWTPATSQPTGPVCRWASNRENIKISVTYVQTMYKKAACSFSEAICSVFLMLHSHLGAAQSNRSLYCLTLLCIAQWHLDSSCVSVLLTFTVYILPTVLFPTEILG